MRHQELSQGQDAEPQGGNNRNVTQYKEDFVLEKNIFNKIFEKDIQRVFMYKKAERLAKAIHLIAPAFAEAPSLRNRIDAIAVGLVDAALLPPSIARTALSRELLTLSSVLAIARTSGLLSSMNADLITKETHFLLQEVAAYEEPRLALDDVPTLADIAKKTTRKISSNTGSESKGSLQKASAISTRPEEVKGHLKDRREAILSVMDTKKQASIKDIARMVRGVSEKTVQRELAALVSEGVLAKQGERRWSTYSRT
jgi:predicted transcriptional regulator